MRTMSLFLKMCIATALAVAALLSAAAANISSEPMVTQKTYVFKAEDSIFTGMVTTNDLKVKTITIYGHNPLRRETVEQLVPRGTASKQGKKPQVTNTAQVFHVDSFCRVALTNRPTARLADVQCGDAVDVDFRKNADGTLIASTIQTAEKHPYDPKPENGLAKKKK